MDPDLGEPLGATAMCTIYVPRPDVLYVEIVDNAVIDVREARAIVQLSLEVYGRAPHYTVVNLRKIRHIERPARDHFGRSDEVGNVLALGLIVGTPLSRMVGNFFVGLSRPRYPTRLVDGLPAAFAWFDTLNEAQPTA